MARKAFTDFIQIKNLREGRWQDGKLVNLYFTIVVGSFSFPRASWNPTTNSLRLNCGTGAKIKGSYVKTVIKLIKAAIVEYRAQIERANESAN